MGMETDFTVSDGCTMHCADDALLSCTLETCMVLVTIVTPINSIKKKDKQIHIPETEKKKTNWHLQNSHGDVKYSIGNIVSNIVITVVPGGH